MKKDLSLFVRQMLTGLGISTVFAAISFLTAGEGMLLGALFIGYAAAAICIFTLVWRTWRSMKLSAEAAKKQMLWGFFVRLFTIFVVFFAAVQISRAVFYTAVLGFALCYGLAMVLLLRRGLLQDKQ